MDSQNYRGFVFENPPPQAQDSYDKQQKLFWFFKKEEGLFKGFGVVIESPIGNKDFMASMPSTTNAGH